MAQSVPGGTSSVGTPALGVPLSAGAGAVVVGAPVGVAVVAVAVADGRAAGVRVGAALDAAGLGRRVFAAGVGLVLVTAGDGAGWPLRCAFVGSGRTSRYATSVRTKTKARISVEVRICPPKRRWRIR